MTDLIPAEAVEAAVLLVAEREYANALRTAPTYAPAAAWADLTETQRTAWANEYRATVTAALTAAAPHIAARANAGNDLAKVWRNGYYAGRDHAESIAAGGTTIAPSNPYLGSQL